MTAGRYTEKIKESHRGSARYANELLERIAAASEQKP